MSEVFSYVERITLSICFDSKVRSDIGILSNPVARLPFLNLVIIVACFSG